MSTPQQFRVLVGPHYTHFDWTTLNAGVVADLDIRSGFRLALSSTSSVIRLVAPTKFPSAGGVWVGGASGVAYEYIRYTGKNSSGHLTGLTREDPALSNHNNVHTTTERAFFWYNLDSNDGKYTVKWSLDNELATSQWDNLTVQGVLYPHWLFRNGHLVVIQTREYPTDSWGAVEYMGIIDSPSASDDSIRDAPWTLKVRPVVSAWQNQPTDGIKVGNLDLAKNSSAQGSTALVLPYEERISSVDFWAGEPDFTASSVVDGDPDTLWIAERFMWEERTNGEMAWLVNNGDPYNGGSGNPLRFNQLYLNPPPGVSRDARFIELVLVSGDADGYSIHSAAGDTTIDWIFGDIDVDAPGLVILTPDADTFAQYNPISSATILENRDWFDHVDATGGDMWLHIGGAGQWKSRIAWGDTNHPLDPTKDGGVGNFPHPDAPTTQYRGGPIAPNGIPTGQTARCIHDRQGTTTASLFWDIGYVRHGGYKIDSEPDQWVIVTLPPLGLKLRDDMAAVSSGDEDKIYIVNDAGGPSTAGLFGVGKIMIGDEWISYVSKDEESVTLGLRGTDSTTAAKHKAGDIIYPVEGGVPTQAHYIKTLGWQRFNGTTYPQRFEVYYTNRDEPRTPETDGYTADWVKIATTTTNTGSAWSYTFTTGARVRALLIRIEAMTVHPARPRLNTVYADVDTTPYASSDWLANGVTAADVIRQLFVNAGVPSAAIVASGTFQPLYNVETAADSSVWAVVTDFASYAGVRVFVDRDSKIRIFPDTLWTTTTFTATHEWTRINAGTIEQVKTSGLGISQIKLNWRNHDDTASGTVVYPATANAIGAVLEISEALYADEDAAMRAATLRWRINRYPFTDIAGGVEGYATMTPRQIHATTWDYNIDDGDMERMHICVGVDQYNENQHLFTVAHLQRIEREVDW